MKLPAHAFPPLPTGAVRPLGWLLRQCRVQADGLTGHLDEFWPSIADSRWIGGDGDGWERGPCWLDGLIPLAVQLKDERLLAKARRWIYEILARQHDDGWFGPKSDQHSAIGDVVLDPWPHFILFKALSQWHDATGDDRIVPAMLRAMRRLDSLLDDSPLSSWAAMRWPELAVSILWLHERVDEAWLLDLLHKAQRQGYDWRAHFADFRYTLKQSEWQLESHIVNHAMALKEPSVSVRAPDAGALPGGGAQFGGTVADAVRAFATLDHYHGQVTGVAAGDECLAGLEPTQGTELCAVVETMYSLELLLQRFGLPEFADRLERVSYNALPAACTADMWAHQYDQQVNQVLCSVAPRDWTTNLDDSNTFGLEPNFGCCTANLHHGWPKLVASLWSRTDDNGIAVHSLAPCQATVDVAETRVEIRVESEYPFRETASIFINADRPTTFPIMIHIPPWAAGASISVDGKPIDAVAPATYARIERVWHGTTRVDVRLPMPLRIEPRPTGGVSILRGPLVLALRIAEEFRHIKGEPPHADWEVHPTGLWNYGLGIDDDLTGCEVENRPVPDPPFDASNPPVIVHMPARRIPSWILVNNSAGPTPPSPANTAEPIETVQLAPYGSTNLRIAEFPRVQTGQ